MATTPAGGKALLLIDINVLGIGSMHEYEYKGWMHAGRETGAIHGAFTKLSKLVNAHGDKVPVVLWDDRCRWREEILPQYKRHRWDTPEQQAFLESYLFQAELIRAQLLHLGIPQLFCPNFEADDLVGQICRNLDADWHITLATTDTDWYQAVGPNVVWQSTRTGQVVTEADLGDTSLVKDGPFVSTDHFIQAKALAGDPSDGIPGVKGVGLKTAAKIIKEHGTIEALWAKHDASEPLKGVVLQRTAGPEYRDTYYRNLKLVDWRLAPPLDRNFRLEFDAPNTDALNATSAQWGLEDTLEPWQRHALPRELALSALQEIREVLEAASSST